MTQAKSKGFYRVSILTNLLAVSLLLSQSGVSGQGNVTARAGSARISLAQPLTLRWRYPSSATLNLTPASDRERVYLPLAGGSIVSLGAREGQLFWKSDVGGEFSASPVADDHTLYVASEATATEREGRPPQGALRALGREAGVTLWLKTLPLPIRGALTVGEATLLAGTSNGGLYSLDKATGNVRWFVQLGSAFNGSPVIYKQSVYVGSEDGGLISLEESSGKVRWRYGSGGPVRGPVAVADDAIFFGSGDGYVYAVNESDGRLRWRSRTGAGVQAVKGVSRGLLAASLDNFVYLLSFHRGKRLWKRQLPGRISAQPATTDDGALFTPISSDVAVVLGLRDGKQVNSLPTEDGSNTAASPIIVADVVFLTTDQGLLAFSQPGNSKSPNRP